jgi:hypothetical protein
LQTVFEGGKRILHENDEEGHRENLPCDKDYDDNYQGYEEGTKLDEKYLEGECFDDFTDLELLRYAEDYRLNIVERYKKNLSEEAIRRIFQALNSVFEGGKLTLKENDEESTGKISPVIRITVMVIKARKTELKLPKNI